jgi:sugar lactone lactonase YvrE
VETTTASTAGGDVIRITGRLLVMALAMITGPVATASADPALQTVYASTLVANGVTVASDGRMFLVVQPGEPGSGPEVVEIRDGAPRDFPDSAWNSWHPGDDGRDSFVGINSIRIGPDGALWVVDRGRPSTWPSVVAGGPKLVKIDLTSNTVVRIYDLAAGIRPWSFVDDVRFRESTAYLTDAGAPGLLVLNLTTGAVRRVLDGHPSTVAQSPLRAEGTPMTDPDGHPITIHADQLEISPDGQWLYYQPASGGMSRVPVEDLDDDVPDAVIAAHVERFADTPPTGGTAMDADGTIYLSDVDTKRILAVSPTGTVSTLIDDPRLIWVDAMWIDDDMNLVMPAAELNRQPTLNGGVDTVEEPITIYRYPLGVRGFRS